MINYGWQVGGWLIIGYIFFVSTYTAPAATAAPRKVLELISLICFVFKAAAAAAVATTKDDEGDLVLCLLSDRG